MMLQSCEFLYSNVFKAMPIWVFATQPIVLATTQDNKPHRQSQKCLHFR